MNNDVLLSLLAMDAYNRTVGEGVVDRGLHVQGTTLGTAVLHQATYDASSGFYVQSYTVGTQTIISYRGTDDLTIWPLSEATDVAAWVAGLGIYSTDQVSFAAEFYRNTIDTLPSGNTVTLTGHSLGGGLAGFVAGVYGEAAVVFDSMPFQAAVNNLYDSTITKPQFDMNGVPLGYWPDDQDARDEYFDGNEPPLPDFDGIRGFEVEGEALQYARDIALYETPTTPLELEGALDPIGPIDRHSASLLVILLYGKEEVSPQNDSWISLREDMVAALFDEEIGLASGAHLQGGSAAIEDKMRMMLAYSAIDQGQRVYGDTGIKVLFSDVNKLAEALNGNAFDGADDDALGEGLNEGEISRSLASIAVQHAVLLAKNKIEASENEDALQGIVVVDTNTNTYAISVDRSAGAWSFASSDETHVIAGLEQLKEQILISLDHSLAATQSVFAILDSVVAIVSAAQSGGTLNASIAENLLVEGYHVNDWEGAGVWAMGSGGADVINGTAGNDALSGGAGNDHLYGGDGNDYLAGGSGDDTLVGGSGSNVLDGGSEIDVADYSGATAGVDIEIGGGTELEDRANVIRVNDNGMGGQDLLLNTERVIGTVYGDTLTLTEMFAEGLQQLEFIDLGDNGSGDLDVVDASALSGVVADFSDSNRQTITEGLLANPTITVKNAEKLIGTNNADYVKLGGSSAYTIDLGGGDDVLDGGGAQSATLYGGSGADTFTDLGAGTIVYGGGEAGVVDRVQLSHGVLFADADADDSVFFGSKTLTGAFGFSTSEKGVVLDKSGWIAYGKNDVGELVILTKMGGQFFIANYSDAQSTAGITIGEIEVSAFRLLDENMPGMDAMVEGLKDSLNLISMSTRGKPWKGTNDPLVLDLDGDGLELLAQTSQSPLFDIDGDGFAERTGWVNSGDGFLVVDENANGVIDDVGEMFGSTTQSGFAELAGYDTNSDGVIDANDTDFGDLKVWRDLNQNGVTDAGELSTLGDLGIASISLTTSTTGTGTFGGNEVTATGTFTRTDSTTGTIGDVNFGADQFNSVYLGDDTVSTAAAAEANLKGHGILTDLHIAMTQNANLLSVVSSVVPTLTSNNLADLRAAVLPVLQAWGATAGAGPAPHDVAVLVHTDVNGNTVVDDFSVYDSVSGTWGWASGDPVLDENDDPIAAPDYEDLLAQDPGTSSWYIFGGETISFLEAYFGEPVFLLDEAVNTGASVVATAATYIENLIEISDLLAVRLAVQGGLSPYFPNIEYDVENENFRSTDDRQLITTYEQILEDLPSDPGQAAAYLANWGGIMDVVVGDFDRGGAFLENSYNFIFANLVAAYESVGPLLALMDIAVAFGIPSDLVVIGAGTITGSGQNDIFYMDGSDQTAQGGVGFDVYVLGKDFGSDTIVDYEGPTEAKTDDMIRFADYASTDITATRDGDDLILTVTGTAHQVRVVGQFTVVHPGLFGGALTGDQGVGEIAFADGVVWDARDIAIAVSDPQATDDTIIGTEDLDYLDGGAGNDVLKGGDSSDVYVFKRGYGDDTVHDRQNNILLTGDDLILFGADISVDDLEFTRNGAANDAVINIKDTDDSLTVTGQFWAADTGAFGVVWLDRVEMFVFADNTILSWIEVMDLTLQGQISDGDDFVYGFWTGDYLDAGTGNDYVSGGDGNDTYFFDAGSGQDIIDDNLSNILSGQDDRVVFGSGIAWEDVILTRDGDHLIITFDGLTDQLTVRDQFNYGGIGYGSYDEIEEYVFFDETVWTAQDVREALLVGTDGDDTLVGFFSPDVMDGGLGNDRLEGGDNADTYIFGLGYGQDVIFDEGAIVTHYEHQQDAVEFGAGIEAGDLSLSRSGRDLVVSIAGVSDTLTIEDQFYYVGAGQYYRSIEYLRFADETEWDVSDIRSLLLTGTSGNDELIGFASADLLDGGAGNDTLRGEYGNDTYVFGVGYDHDTIQENIGSAYYHSTGDKVTFDSSVDVTDVTVTQTGNDLVFTLTSGETLTVKDQFHPSYSSSRVETFEFSDSTVWTHANILAILEGRDPNVANIEGTSAGETLNGTAEDDIIDAKEGDDTITGGFGNDQIIGGAGNDTMDGGRGGDTYLYSSGDGNDIIDELDTSTGSTSVDTLKLLDLNPEDVTLTRTHSPSNLDLVVTINATGEQILIDDHFDDQDHGIEALEFANGAIWNRAEIQAAAWMRGTTGDDTITGSGSADTIDGGAGNDTLNGGSGADTIIGGLDNDTLLGGAGSDTYLFGAGDGSDLIDEAGSSVDVDTLKLIGLNVADVTVSRSYSPNTNDLIVTINATGEQVRVDQHFNSTTYGIEQIEFADSTIWDRSQMLANAWIRGTEGDDTITGSSSTDVIHGGAGNDTIDGGGGNDTIDGGVGNDVLTGGAGNDTFLFGVGFGSDVVDEYDSPSGNVDTLRLVGLNADDVTLSRSYSPDTDDLTVTIKSTGEQVRVDDHFKSTWYGVTQIEFADATVWNRTQILANSWMLGTENADTITGTTGADNIDGGAGDDTLNGGSGNDLILGGVGSDTLNGVAGNDSLYGDDGDDILDGGAGDDLLYGGDGDDVLSGGTGSDSFDGGNGFDTADFTYSSAIWTIDLAAGTATSGTSVETLTSIESAVTGSGNDILRGNAEANYLSSGGGNDTLEGGAGDDTLDGGAGTDSLYGEAGADTLTGGTGNDTFYFATGDGADTIEDFTAGSGVADLIDLTGVGGVEDLSDVLALAYETAGNTTIDFGDGDSITLLNVALTTLHADDFRFAA